MRIHPRTWLTALAATAGVLSPARTSAQIDLEPPRPNVLLLIDTSGSMEYLPDGTLPTQCDPATVTTQVNRWTALVQSLTGTVNDRRCFAHRRNPGSQPPSALDFVDEFEVGGLDPYDKGYKLPYHRIVSGAGGAVVTPGTAPTATYDWPANAIQFRTLNSTTKGDAATAGWSQQNNGLIDVFGDRLRFALMTFDPVPEDPVSTTMPGMWSYFPGWISSTAGAAKGNPVDCISVLKPFDVGCRNPGAPPWEGRLIGFGPTGSVPAPYTSLLEYQRANNERVQQALLAIRPYGATPLAGMMADAYTFFRVDTAEDPTVTLPNGSHPRFGVQGDPFYSGGCRESYMIVLSDGEPNLDMRPSCEPTSTNPALNGNCPYEQPWYYADQLASITASGQAVKTFAVGFGMSKDKVNTPAQWDCTTIDEANWSTRCSAANIALYPPLKACCTLARIAIAGDTHRAYFPDTPEDLRTALSQVLSEIASKSTSRTLPAFSSGTAVGSATAPAVAYEFVSSFQTLTDDNIWTGNLERKRWVCKEVSGVLQAVLEDIDEDLGDNFTMNVHESAPERKFFTAIGTEEGSLIHSTRTIRKSNAIDDDLTDYVVDAAKPTTLRSRSQIASDMDGAPLAMGIPSTAPSYCSTSLGTSDDGTCAARLMTWEVGGTNSGLAPTREKHQFGAIYHSSPTVFGAPSDFLRDESYSTFSDTTGNAQRPLMLYTATTDGQLHAFQVATNKPGESDPLGDELENNELWAFIPPYVLPHIYSQYPNSQQILLDGAPVVRDVVFERTEATAQAATSAWHTVLVAGGGSAGGFYYALDVTNPTAPVFLWQLSTDDAGTPLFGPTAATPAIATIGLVADPLATPPTVKEVAVAILPGGTGTLSTDCDGDGTDKDTRKVTSYTHINKTLLTPKPRNTVRCWAKGPGRSLTIVRLDNGEILRTFRGHAEDGPNGAGTTLNSTRVGVVGFDSPITGVPVPYPSRPGQVSDRIYVGDADGTLWRISVAKPNPADWRADLAFDAYSPDTGYSDGYNQGQPVAIPPVVGVDGLGNTVILFATGDQDDFTTYDANMRTRLWSLKEIPVKEGSVPFRMDSNWVIKFTGGKRVTGPIALFDTVAYFATFEPKATAADACVDGFGSIWGVDYLKPQSGSNPPYPIARLEQKVGTTTTIVHYKDEAPGVVVFGVMVSAQPSCFDTDDNVPDTYLGKHTAITTTTPPVYQLVYQTGAGGTASGGATTKTNTQTLPPLRELTRVDSWASIVE